MNGQDRTHPIRTSSTLSASSAALPAWTPSDSTPLADRGPRCFVGDETEWFGAPSQHEHPADNHNSTDPTDPVRQVWRIAASGSDHRSSTRLLRAPMSQGGLRRQTGPETGGVSGPSRRAHCRGDGGNHLDHRRRPRHPRVRPTGLRIAPRGHERPRRSAWLGSIGHPTVGRQVGARRARDQRFEPRNSGCFCARSMAPEALRRSLEDNLSTRPDVGSIGRRSDG